MTTYVGVTFPIGLDEAHDKFLCETECPRAATFVIDVVGEWGPVGDDGLFFHG